MKQAGRIVVYAMLLFWSLFPNDEVIRVIGFGPEGARLMLLDVLVLLAVIFALCASWKEFSRGVRSVSAVGLTLLLGVASFSLLRGLSQYGGFAIGEARWYYLFILLPTTYVLFEGEFLRVLTRIYVAAALVQTIRIPVLYLTRAYEESDLGVIRFIGGRDVLIIAIAILLLVHRGTMTRRYSLSSFLLLVGFSLAIIVNQVRSFLFIFPVILLLYFVLQRAISVRQIVFMGTTFSGLLAIILIFLPKEILQSVSTSLEVLTDLVNPTTYEVLFNISDFGQYMGSEFSQAGNTLFRFIAWSQTINDVFSTPGAWIWGLPLGSGYYFRDAGGGEYVNLDPHNDYVSIFSKTGIVGLLGYVAILASYVRSLHRYRRTVRWRNDAMVIATVVFLLLLFVGVNAEIRSYASHFLVWIFLGMSVRQLASTRPLPSVTRGLTSASVQGYQG